MNRQVLLLPSFSYQVVLVYAVFGSLWILFSDQAIALLTDIPQQVTHFQTLKGWAFIAVTSMLLYIVIERGWRSHYASYNLLHSIIESTTNAIFVKDLQGRYVLVNPVSAEIIGHDVADIIGEVDHKFFTPDIADVLQQTDRAIMASGQSLITEEFVTVGDEFRTFISQKTPWRSRSGEVIGLIGVAQDITQRKQAEQALRESEAKYRLLFEANPHAMWVYDLETLAFLEVNQTAVKRYGYSRDEFLGMTLRDIRPAEDIPTLLQDVGQELPELNYAGLWRHCKRNGDLIDVEIISHTLTFDGRSARLVLANDVTEQQQTRRALQESEQRLEEILQSLDDVVWSMAAETGRLSYLSPAAEQVCGHPLQAFLVNPSLWFEMVHPADRSRVETYSQALPESGSKALEYRIVRPDGEVRWLSDRARIIYSASGQPLRTDGIATDITDRKQIEVELRASESRYRDLSATLEERVRQRTEELRQRQRLLEREVQERQQAEQALNRVAINLQRSNQELEQFAYVASHDLQEPLRAIEGYTQLLAQDYQALLDETAQVYMAFVVDGASRMRHLIQDLLAYSRVGTRPQKPKPIACHQVLAEAQLNLQVAIAECQATITHPPLPTVLADPVQLVQLFQNLISNAIKFHRELPPTIHIHVVKQAKANPELATADGPGQEEGALAPSTREEWLFSVQDNGIGIKPRYLDRIFVIFKRLHTRRQYDGTGIGLAVCKKIIERHGGRIWAESVPGVGTTFYFTLPALPAERDERPVPAGPI